MRLLEGIGGIVYEWSGTVGIGALWVWKWGPLVRIVSSKASGTWGAARVGEVVILTWI